LGFHQIGGDFSFSGKEVRYSIENHLHSAKIVGAAGEGYFDGNGMTALPGAETDTVPDERWQCGSYWRSANCDAPSYTSPNVPARRQRMAGSLGKPKEEPIMRVKYARA